MKLRSVLGLALGWLVAGLGAAEPLAVLQPSAGPAATVDPLASLQQDFQRSVSAAIPAVVGFSNGSGVVIREDGWLLTVAHVAESAGRYLPVTFPDGRKTKAYVWSTHHDLDLAIAQIIDPGPWPCITLGDPDQVHVGDWVAAIGYPVSFSHGTAPAVRGGRVLKKRGGVTLTTDSPIMGGDSGGALVDLQGRLIAIGSRCQPEVSLNHFIALNAYRQHWSRLMAGGNLVARPGQQTLHRHGFPRRPPLESPTVVEDENAGPGEWFSAPTGATVTVMRPTWESKDAKQRMSREAALEFDALATAVETARIARVELTHGGDDPSLLVPGTLLGRDGLVAAKASLLRGVPRDQWHYRLADGTVGTVAWIGEDHEEDLAVLRFSETSSLESRIQWSEEPLELGTMVISYDGTQPRLGFLGSQSRSFSHRVSRDRQRSQAEHPAYDRWGGGPFSDQRFGFSRVLTHDMPLAPEQCGSPLVDVQGKLVGINISRALRVATFSLETRRVFDLLSTMLE